MTEISITQKFWTKNRSGFMLGIAKVSLTSFGVKFVAFFFVGTFLC